MYYNDLNRIQEIIKDIPKFIAKSKLANKKAMSQTGMSGGGTAENVIDICYKHWMKTSPYIFFTLLDEIIYNKTTSESGLQQVLQERIQKQQAILNEERLYLENLQKRTGGNPINLRLMKVLAIKHKRITRVLQKDIDRLKSVKTPSISDVQKVACFLKKQNNSVVETFCHTLCQRNFETIDLGHKELIAYALIVQRDHVKFVENILIVPRTEFVENYKTDKDLHALTYAREEERMDTAFYEFSLQILKHLADKFTTEDVLSKSDVFEFNMYAISRGEVFTHYLLRQDGKYYSMTSGIQLPFGRQDYVDPNVTLDMIRQNYENATHTSEKESLINMVELYERNKTVYDIIPKINKIKSFTLVYDEAFNGQVPVFDNGFVLLKFIVKLPTNSRIPITQMPAIYLLVDEYSIAQYLDQSGQNANASNKISQFIINKLPRMVQQFITSPDENELFTGQKGNGWQRTLIMPYRAFDDFLGNDKLTTYLDSFNLGTDVNVVFEW